MTVSVSLPEGRSDNRIRIVLPRNRSFVMQPPSNQITRTFHLQSSAEGDNSQVVYVGPCRVFNFDCYNTGPAGLRLGIFDLDRVPVDEDQASWLIELPGQDNTQKSWGGGLTLSKGLAIDVMAETDGLLVQGILTSLNIGYSPVEG